MEQNGYKSVIILALLSKKNHVRGLAKKLKTNHMMISRKIKQLLAENVVDFEEQGKNKVYFLKKTTESRMAIFDAENYKLVKLIKDYPKFRKVIDVIHKDSKIKFAIIFGSYIKGTSNKNSDIDIFIETKDTSIRESIELLDSSINVKIGKFDKKTFLAKEIEKNHVIVKGVETFYEKIKFFD